ncbi:MAG: hypothetical protein QOK24_30 [Verrucomicrobiota bacterium]|jgi:hypothetical protein
MPVELRGREFLEVPGIKAGRIVDQHINAAKLEYQ